MAEAALLDHAQKESRWPTEWIQFNQALFFALVNFERTL